MKISRIEREKKVVEFMVRLYCRKKEGNYRFCSECNELMEYAQRRLHTCHYGEKKPACKDCPVHCFKPVMREKMCQVMRFSGPRMIFYAPKEFFRHIFRK